MRKPFISICLLAMCFSSSCCTAKKLDQRQNRAQRPSRDANPNAVWERTDGFDEARGHSYYWDFCGDGAYGRAFRRALADKVDHCPFTAEAKTRYHSIAQQEATAVAKQVKEYFTTHHEYPAEMENGAIKCAMLKTNETRTHKKLLQQYLRGKIQLDQALPKGTCRQGGAF